MIIEKEQIKQAKEKLGDKNAVIISELLELKDFDKRNLKAKCPYHNEDTASFIYDKKHFRFHCFGCGTNVDVIDALMHGGDTYLQACKKLFDFADMKYSFGEEGVKTKSQYIYPKETPLNDKSTVYNYLGKRGISKDVIDYLDIREDHEGNCVFNFYDTNDVLTMKKFRPARTINKAKKEVKCWCDKHSDKSPLLFNMNRINVNQALLITEGEIDAASAIEAGFYNTVSVPIGANNFQWLEENFDWLEQFETIIIAADNDEAGDKMRTECIYRLGTWRCKVVEYPKFKELSADKKIPIKDMNDTLQSFGSSYVMAMIINAKDTPVESVVDFSDVEDVDVSTIGGILTGIEEFDKEMMRLFYSTFNILTGVNGGGKSSFLGQLCCNCIEQGNPVWMYSGEMANFMVKNWIDSIFAGARNVDEHVNSTGSRYYTIQGKAKKEISEYYRNNLYLYKDEEENTIPELQKSMEECVRKFGCKLFILDNMSSINLDCSDDTKWQKQVDFVNWLIRFAKKFHVVVLLVIHPKKIETMRRLTKFDVQGLGTVVDLAHRLFSLYRVTKKEKEDPKNPIKFDVILDVLKDRMRGREGLDVGMYYDNASRRFYTNEKEYNKQYSWDKNTYNEPLPYPKKEGKPFD